MKKFRLSLLVVGLIGTSILFTSCSFNSNAGSSAYAQLNLTTDDVEISEQMEASASETLVLFIDFKRLFKKESGKYRGRHASFALPIIGNTPQTRVEAYAIYKLLKANSDWDAVMYPQFDGTTKGFLPFFEKTDVTVKARMVRIK